MPSVTPPFSAIPTPTTDPASLQDAVMRMKETVEQITGDRAGLRMASIYIQDTVPDASVNGTLWLCTNAQRQSLNVAVGNKWLQVGTLT